MDWTRGPTIGRGSTATVSLATSLPSGELFAVKSTELANSTSLQREGSFLSKISSNFVVKYLGHQVTTENNVPVYNLCLEYVSGGTLQDEIKRQGGRLDETKIRSYTRDILKGLEYLHGSVGLAHCDIKSQNVLVTQERAKIADLGCARWVEGAPSTSAFSGTPAFMSPEVARGEDQGYAADIWSLGCTIIEMATGKRPWEDRHQDANDPVSVLYRIGFSGDVPEVPACLSGMGKDFLRKCLRREAEERWMAEELLGHPFVGELTEAREIDQELTMTSFSPSCVLDQGFWYCMESPHDQVNWVGLDNPDGADERIKRLLGFGGDLISVLEVPNWDLEGDEYWITVRSNFDGKETTEHLGDESSSILQDQVSVSSRLLVPNLIVHEQEEAKLLLSDHFLVFEDISTISIRNRDMSTCGSGLDDFVSENFDFETDNNSSSSPRSLTSLFFLYFYQTSIGNKYSQLGPSILQFQIPYSNTIATNFCFDQFYPCFRYGSFHSTIYIDQVQIGDT